MIVPPFPKSFVIIPRIHLLILLLSLLIELAGCKENSAGGGSPIDGTWTSLGLEKENITAIALDPINTKILYVGSSYDFSKGIPGRIFKSIDEGKTWDTLFVDYGAKVTSIIIDPHNPQIVYAAPWGIIKSLDAGKTWHYSDNGIFINPEVHVSSMAIDLGNSSILYAGVGGPFGGGLYKSTDAGANWLWIGDSLQDGVTTIAIDPVNSNTVYVGTAQRGIVWKSLDGGGIGPAAAYMNRA